MTNTQKFQYNTRRKHYRETFSESKLQYSETLPATHQIFQDSEMYQYQLILQVNT